MFASYAFALLGALLVFGALSDHRGRREVIIAAALVLELASLLVFRHADVGRLAVRRRALLQGAATGMATSALSAGMLDVDRERGSLLNSVSPLVGMGVGALGAGALARVRAGARRGSCSTCCWSSWPCRRWPRSGCPRPCPGAPARSPR